MPNKTIYVSDEDIKVLERAQQVSGGQPLRRGRRSVARLRPGG
nr:hypothetical protein [Gordonia sp. LAM0048]